MSLWHDTKYRFRRLWLTNISKSWMVFWIASAFLCWNKIDGWMWLAAAGVATGVNAYSKTAGHVPDMPKVD